MVLEKCYREKHKIRQESLHLEEDIISQCNFNTQRKARAKPTMQNVPMQGIADPGGENTCVGLCDFTKLMGDFPPADYSTKQRKLTWRSHKTILISHRTFMIHSRLLL